MEITAGPGCLRVIGYRPRPVTNYFFVQLSNYGVDDGGVPRPVRVRMRSASC